MAIQSVLAVVPSRDLATARKWWSRLFGLEPDAVPMPTDIEWHVPGGGGLQLIDDPRHAGATTVTLVVDDVDRELAALRYRGLEAPTAETVPTGQFRIASLADPDGNSVVLAQALPK